MTTTLALIAQLLHAALMLAAAPLLVGGIDRLRARLLGRIGPPLPLPWRNLLKLARKQPVVAEGASWVFTGAPIVALAASWAAASLVPSFAFGMTTAPLSDLIGLAGLLGLARGALVLAGMDVGTAFGGLGAGRTLMVAALAEPALLLVIFTLSLLAGSTNLDAITAAFLTSPPGLRTSLGLVLMALLLVVVAENGRRPVADPATHPEPAMMQGAMVLEYSGRHLALLELASAVRLLLAMALLMAIFAPVGVVPAGAPLLWPLGLAAWAAKVAVLGAALAGLEAWVTRMRIARIPEFLGVAVLLGVLAALFLFVSQGLAAQ